MRKLWLAAALGAGTMCAATPAMAQRVWQNGRWIVLPPRTPPMVMPARPHRWGPMVDGRWEAGFRAPGGWAAYRRLERGATLPGYWRGYRIPDYLSFGLAAPPRGYHWVRYYDDAVLVDERDRVWHSIDGIAWGGAGVSAAQSHAYSEASVNVGAGYPPPGRIETVDPDDYYYHDGDYREPDRDPEAFDEPLAYAPPREVVQPLPPHRPHAPPAVQVLTPGAGSTAVAPVTVQVLPQQAGQVYAGGGVTVIVINPAPVVTTTTVVRKVRIR